MTRRSPAGTVIAMMALVFATLLAAFLLDRLRWRLPALVCLGLCFVLSAWLFQWEIHSPEYGYRMPWLQF